MDVKEYSRITGLASATIRARLRAGTLAGGKANGKWYVGDTAPDSPPISYARKSQSDIFRTACHRYFSSLRLAQREQYGEIEEVFLSECAGSPNHAVAARFVIARVTGYLDTAPEGLDNSQLSAVLRLFRIEIDRPAKKEDRRRARIDAIWRYVRNVPRQPQPFRSFREAVSLACLFTTRHAPRYQLQAIKVDRCLVWATDGMAIIRCQLDTPADIAPGLYDPKTLAHIDGRYPPVEQVFGKRVTSPKWRAFFPTPLPAGEALAVGQYGTFCEVDCDDRVRFDRRYLRRLSQGVQYATGACGELLVSGDGFIAITLPIVRQ